MIFGQDLSQVLAMFVTPNNPILLALLGVGVGYFLDPAPEEER